MVMLRLREHLPEDVKPLDEVRDEVADSVRYRRSMDEAAERANALMARVAGRRRYFRARCPQKG